MSDVARDDRLSFDEQVELELYMEEIDLFDSERDLMREEYTKWIIARRTA